MTTKTKAKTKTKTTKASVPAPGFRLKKILVPIDFSECSVKALHYAQAFAKQSQTEIILLHVVEPISYPMYGQDMAADLSAFQTDLMKIGEAHLIRFGKEHGTSHDSFKLVISEGSAYPEIIETAKAEDVDLIIISTHGRTGLSHVLMGSTAERVVRHAPCPVLTVREREHEFVK